MQIQAIYLKHVGPFSQLKVQFDYSHAPITLILGDQASGKTLLLKQIYQMLTWFPAKLKESRIAGLAIADQDIANSHSRARVDIQIQVTQDIQHLAKKSPNYSEALPQCTWTLYKTLNQRGVGVCQGDTLQLEYLTEVYRQAIQQDPLQGLPCIGFYPADRFVHEVNLTSKNTPAIFQAASAYDITAASFTTFGRFFEWLREVFDVENAQSAQLLQQLLIKIQSQDHKKVDSELLKAYAKMSSPHLHALKSSLKLVIPELSDIFLQYQPTLMLMVTYQGQNLAFLQLSNALKTWIALVGDIVRRLCLLNPFSFYPCTEGDGIILIDHIDAQLDQTQCREILPRLHRAFPRLQIIVTGNREELLEHAAQYQCLKLSQHKISACELQQSHVVLEQLYQELFDSESLPDPFVTQQANEPIDFQCLIEQLNQLTDQQKIELLQHLHRNLQHIDTSQFYPK